MIEATHSLYKKSSHGTYGSFALEIKVGASPKLPPLGENMSDEIYTAVYHAAKSIEAAIRAEIIKNTPEAINAAIEEKAKILACFPEIVAPVEEIPNEYCSDYCHKHLPWFIVTTRVGRIKIGWRKSVIVIDWSETIRTKNSHELFEAENVTKEERLIHTWGYGKATQYIKAIIDSMV